MRGRDSEPPQRRLGHLGEARQRGVGFQLRARCAEDEPEPPAPEYGVPSARFRLDGIVTARATGRPIPGIRIFLSRGARPDSSLDATSGADGHWQLDFTAFPCGGTCGLITTDEDGPDNGGAFATGIVPLELIQTMPGNGHWFLGTFEQHDISVSLDPQARSR